MTDEDVISLMIFGEIERARRYGREPKFRSLIIQLIKLGVLKASNDAPRKRRFPTWVEALAEVN